MHNCAYDVDKLDALVSINSAIEDRTSNNSNIGILSSSEKNVENKVVDIMVNINNSIGLTQQEKARDTHNRVILNQKIYIASCLMVLVEVVKLTVFATFSLKKKLKKTIGKNTTT